METNQMIKSKCLFKIKKIKLFMQEEVNHIQFKQKIEAERRTKQDERKW